MTVWKFSLSLVGCVAAVLAMANVSQAGGYYYAPASYYVAPPIYQGVYFASPAPLAVPEVPIAPVVAAPVVATPVYAPYYHAYAAPVVVAPSPVVYRSSFYRATTFYGPYRARTRVVYFR